MNDGRIATRYAKALLEAAESQGVAQEVYQAAQSMHETLLKHGVALAKALGNPLLTEEERIALGNRLFAATPPLIHGLVDLMLRKGRGPYTARAIMRYVDLYREAHGIIHADVESAAPLAEDTRKRLEQFVATRYPEGLEFEYHVLPELVGGMRLTVGGNLFDRTVQGELERVRRQLASRDGAPARSN